jgi:hypothetical protein
MFALGVGQKAPDSPRFFTRQGCPPVRCGTSFNLLEDGRPFIVTYLWDITEEEVWHIGEGKIKTAYWREHCYWLGLIKMGEMLQQLVFDPMVQVLNYQRFSGDLFRENRLVNFVGIDSRDMRVKALRAATYPWKFLASLHEAFKQFQPRANYTSDYRGLIKKFDQLPLPLLWEFFTPGGYFGEKRLKE